MSSTISSGRATVAPIDFALFPPEGSRSVATQYDWRLRSRYADDLSHLTSRGFETTVQTAVIDNTANSQSVTLLMRETGQSLICPAYSAAIFPLFTAGGRFSISTIAPVVATTRVQFLNTLLGPSVSGPAGPTLDLNFLTGVLDPRLSFTRASTGTYFDAIGTMQTAGVNVARFDNDPVSHLALGLLIEESRANLALQSADFTQGIWSKGFCSVTPAATTAPDGTLAGRIVEDATNNSHGISQAIAKAASALPFSYSVFCKADTRTTVRLLIEGSVSGNIQCNFDLLTGIAGTPAVTGGFVLIAVTQQAVGKGWYRCTIAVTTNTDPGILVDVYLISGGAVTYQGDGVSGAFVWGAQTEAGAFSTSYIATTAATVTRAADQAALPWNAVYPFSLAGDAMVPQLAPVNAEGLVVLTDGTTANRVALRANALAQATMGGIFTVGGANTTVTATVNQLTIGSPFSAALAAPLAGGLTLVGNGGAPVAGAGAGPAGMVLMTLGQTTTPGNFLNGWLRRVRYWPRALPNDELITVTTT